MKFKVIAKNVNTTDDQAWCEEYEENILNAHQWAVKTITRFNHTLRPHEKERELIMVLVLEDNNAALHDWDKDVNKMSVPGRNGHQMYDGMRCRKCGITGKRFGLSAHIKIDSKYRKKAFQRCDTAKIEMVTGKYK